ncbi:hypothetical protein RB195_005335 [Necator americanus]|uniref:SCP domain-containing protein n=1 Tax=Necator americanus TaxID=51031 RepID=A0ABR1BMD0_NECAM
MRSVLSEEELDKTTLLTYGLEERVAEGSGLSDGESLLLSQADYGRCDDSVVRTTDRNYILYTHNRLRSKLAQGRQPNKEGMMSSGKNVYLLKWDCDLERLAHDWAKTCPKFPVADAKIPSGSQLVKMAHCEKRTIYEPGPPCQSDDDCSTYPNSRCISTLGLCQAPDIPGDRTANNLCGALNTSMTDYSRKTALDLHNFYRSRLARGLEFNGETNSTQHGARNMMKLEYDCHLEKYAQAWADGCKFEHSNSWERPNQGQNLYMTTIRNWETTSLLHTAIEIWWKELEEFGMPSNAILSEDVWIRKGSLIGHFTQMACGKSQRLGCAVSKCPDMEFVVCHYSPAGNRKRHAIYEIGPTCKKGSDCPLDCLCMGKEGLCAVRKTPDFSLL